MSFKSDGADNFCIVEVEDGLSAAMGWMSLLGLNTLSAEVLRTPIFRVLAYDHRKIEFGLNMVMEAGSWLITEKALDMEAGKGSQIPHTLM